MPFASAAEAALYFVGDAEAAVFSHDVVNDLEILLGRRDDTADALHAFADEDGHFAAGFVFDHVFDVAGAFHVAGGIRQAVGATIAIAGRGVFDGES
jgi:hypothetical protein